MRRLLAPFACRLLAPFAALLVAAAPAAFAQVPAPLVEEFVEAAQLDRQATEFANQIAQLTAMQAAQFPEPARSPFRDAFAEALAAEAVQARLRDYLTRNADVDSLRAALDWLRDPLVAQMQERELAASTDPGAQVAVQMYATSGRLGRHAVTPEEEARVNELLEVSGAMNSGVDVFLDFVAASNRLNAAILGIEMPDETLMREQLRGQLAEQVGGSVRGVALYAYREVPEEEFAAYVATSGTPQARYYNRIASRAIGYAVSAGVDEAGATFAEAFEAMGRRGEVDVEGWRAGIRAQMEAQQRMMRGDGP